MLETILIFAAGFLTASVLAMMIAPSINARANRLARRRLAAQFPISIEELTAQMDYVRAEGAVEIRKLERLLDREREAHAKARAQIGAVETARLRDTRDVGAERDQLKEENAKLRAERDALEQDRDERRIAIASLETQLASANTALTALRRTASEAASGETVERDTAQDQPTPADIARENELLRKRIEALAAEIMARADARKTPPAA